MRFKDDLFPFPILSRNDTLIPHPMIDTLARKEQFLDNDRLFS